MNFFSFDLLDTNLVYLLNMLDINECEELKHLFQWIRECILKILMGLTFVTIR
jgi:hypothetical protein